MPLLSFVLVVHREQAFLQQCVESLLTVDDVELVVIDDASPDHAPGLLDELAERDRRVRVHHLDERVGTGRARNLALDLVAGDHVWFVETKDRLPAGSVVAAMHVLQGHAPDLVLVPHATLDALGRRREGPHAGVLARMAEDGPGPLVRHPRAASLAPHAWNKIFSRALLRELGVRFGDGRSSELTATWPALLAARRISALPATGYLRRRLDLGVPEPGTPLDVFDQYDAVFAFASRPEVPAAARRLVLAPMVDHLLTLMGRLPESEREAFFTRVADAYRRHRRGDEPEPRGRADAVRRRALERGSYAGHRVLEASLARRRAIRRPRQALARNRRRLRAVGLDRYYRARLRQPIDPDLAIFAAYWYRSYACNPRAIYEKLRELRPEVRGVWVVKPEDAAALPPGVEHVAPNTREYFDLIARAGFFVNNVNFPNHLVKREGSVHVMTHHGTPLKTMGLDQQGMSVAGGRMDFGALLRRCRRWDFSISSNAFSTLIWERVYPVPYESLETGYPRNDALVNATEDDVARARTALGIRPDQVAVLYAPTHREYDEGYVPLLDLASVAEGLGPDHVLLARLHYFYDADPLLRALDREGRVLDVAAHPSVEELCLAADVLVTDYSSIMFDYATLDRPIVIHAPDWERYRSVRGTYFDLLEEAPGPVTRTEAELVEALRSGAADAEDAARDRAAFRARFCALEDGRAAERVVRRVWFGERAAAETALTPAGR